MKRMRLFAKASAIFVALLMLLSFTGCNAAPGEGMGPEWEGINPYPNGGSGLAGIMGGASGGSQEGSAAGDVEYDDAVTPGDSPEFDVEGVKPDVPSQDVNGTATEAEGEENKEETNSSTVGDEPGGNQGQEVTDLLSGSFVSVALQPYSTFSADVDTGSYTYFRKLISSGYGFDVLRRSGSNFRIEEFINYFKYDVEQPREGELFGVKTELVACPWNESNLLLRVTLRAEDAKPSKGNNLVFLIDVSGSMSSQDKLPLLKKAFSYLVGNLGANDTVSIVTYSGRESIVLDGCSGLDTDKILSAIDSLVASGSTNGEAGLTEAYRLAEEHFIEGGNNRIIMASDGDLNVGISSKSELVEYIEQKRDQGVYLSVLGFGTGNYRDENMEALADNGNGVYYYIDGESEAEKVFGTDLAGTLYTVANDVKLQIQFDVNCVESYRIIGYDNRILDKDDFEDDTKDAGDVGASHQVTVVYEIKPAEQVPGANTLATLRVRYKNPGESLSLLNEYSVSRNVELPSDDMRFIEAVIETAALLRNGDYTGEISLTRIAEELNALTLEDSYKAEFRELIKGLAQN